MRGLLVLAVVAGTMLGQSPSMAQGTCGRCGVLTSVQACVSCSTRYNPGSWSLEGMRRWCTTNMPRCRAGQKPIPN
jgi:hypothetical protein